MIQLDSTEARKFAVHLEGYEGLGGGELIKNGDFSDVGANVVDNGAFSELGTDVILNGGFDGRSLGLERINNGDFATGALPNWLASSTGDGVTPTVVSDGAGGYGAEISNGALGDNSYIYQTGIFAAGLRYKVSYRIVSNTMSGINNIRIQDYETLDSTVGTHHVYIWGHESSNALFKRNGSNVSIVITDISIKEANLISDGNFSEKVEILVNGNFGTGLMTPWLANSTGDGVTPTVEDLGGGVYATRIKNGVLGDNSNISQTGIFGVGKSYKITYEIISNTLPLTNFIRLQGYVDLVSTVGTHSLYVIGLVGETNALFKRKSGQVNCDIVVTNFSIEELASDWETTSWIFENDNAIATGDGTSLYLKQDFPITTGKQYEFTYTISENSLSPSVTNQVALSKFGGFSDNGESLWLDVSVGTRTIIITATDDSPSAYAIQIGVSTSMLSGTIKISEVILQELGEDWTQGTGWTMGTSKAISTQSLGSQLVLNPDFTDIGTDVIASRNGNFEDGSTDWGVNIAGTDTITFATDQVRIVSDGVGGTGISNTIPLGVGTSYKVTIDVESLTGQFKIQMGAGGTSTKGLVTSSGVSTFYRVGVASDFLIYRDVGYSCDALINSVKVEVLGDDWTVTGEDRSLGYYVDFIDTGAHYVAPTSSPIVTFKTSSLILLSGETYKVEVEMTQVSGGVKWDIGGVDETFNETTSGTNNTRYVTPTSNTTFSLYRNVAPVDITFHSVLIKQIDTSYLTQAGVITADKTWKVIYTLSDFLAGSVSATEWGTPKTADEVGITDFVQIGTTTDFRMVNIGGYFEGAVTDISAQLVDPNEDWTLGTGWSIGADEVISDGTASSEVSQSFLLTLTDAYRITFEITSFISGTGFKVKVGYDTPYSISYNTVGVKSLCQRVVEGGAAGVYFLADGLAKGSITNVSVQKLDPDEDWNIGLGWCIGVDKAESDGTVNSTNINQQGALTSPIGKTYTVQYKIEDFISGGLTATIGGLVNGLTRVADGTYIEFITVTASAINIIGFSGGVTSFDGSITDISVRLKDTGAVTLTLINQLTEKVTTVAITPLVTNGRYTEFSYQPTGLIEGMYLIKFTGDSGDYAETLAYITTGTPPLGESSYTEYTTGDDNPDHVYIP